LVTSGVGLAAQLQHTASVLAAVAKGQRWDGAMARVAPALRPAVQALSFHAMRYEGWARTMLGLLASRAPAPWPGALLKLALVLLRAQDAMAYARHTVVNQAVSACRAQDAQAHAAGWVNACLRRYLRETQALEATAAQTDEARDNLPSWWAQRWRAELGTHAQAVMSASREHPPMVLRVNRRRCQVNAYLGALAAAGLSGRPVGQDGLMLEHAVPVHQLPGWAQGWVSVQDGAAQLAAPLLLAALPMMPGRPRVLDACAAPGGKTAHLLERGDVDVLALDLDAERLKRVQSSLQRLGLGATLRAADAAQPRTWHDGVPFDGILLDAPCSASGIVRRHPDIPWLRRPQDIDGLTRRQCQLLRTLWPLLKPGGCLVYAVCSVFDAEGPAQADWFARQYPEAQPLAAPGRLLPGVCVGPPGLGDNPIMAFDGFFYAAWRKPQPVV
jgi:16S rRNA (cytosine967-C5)-methyltransferase